MLVVACRYAYGVNFKMLHCLALEICLSQTWVSTLNALLLHLSSKNCILYLLGSSLSDIKICSISLPEQQDRHIFHQMSH